jgi:hypothetical protein
VKQQNLRATKILKVKKIHKVKKLEGLRFSMERWLSVKARHPDRDQAERELPIPASQDYLCRFVKVYIPMAKLHVLVFQAHLGHFLPLTPHQIAFVSQQRPNGVRYQPGPAKEQGKVASQHQRVARGEGRVTHQQVDPISPVIQAW